MSLVYLDIHKSKVNDIACKQKPSVIGHCKKCTNFLYASNILVLYLFTSHIPTQCAGKFFIYYSEKYYFYFKNSNGKAKSCSFLTNS